MHLLAPSCNAPCYFVRQGQDAATTPAHSQTLTSRLKRIRTVKGPGHLNQALEMLAKARKDGVPRDITSYNVLIKVGGEGF